MTFAAMIVDVSIDCAAMGAMILIATVFER